MLVRLLVLGFMGLLLAGCGSEEAATPPHPPPLPPPPASTSGTLSGTTLDGERVSLADFRGKPVFVNVWSSW